MKQIYKQSLSIMEGDQDIYDGSVKIRALHCQYSNRKVPFLFTELLSLNSELHHELICGSDELEEEVLWLQ